jgi:hypothetical protein
MRTLFGVLILAASSFFCLIPGAESKSPREKETLSGESTSGRHDFFEKADADRDGFMDWKEYRDYYRDGTRGDFYRRDRDRDDRLGRDEWKQSEDRRDRGRSWR